MLIKLIITVAFLAGLLLPQAAYGQNNLTCTDITQVLKLASERDPAILIAIAEEKVENAAIKSSRSLYQPQISAFSRTGVGDTSLTNSAISNQVGLRLSQRIYDFGNAKYARAAARNNYMASQHETQNARNRAAMEAGFAFIQRQEVLEELKLTRQRRKYFSDQVKIINSMLSAGEATRFERAEVAAHLAETESYELELGFRQKHAEVLLETRTDIIQKPYCPQGPLAALLQDRRLVPGNIALTINKVLNDDPNIKALEYRAKGLEAVRKRQKLSRLPIIDVVATGAYSSVDAFDKFKFRQRIGVSLSVPIFSGGAMAAQKQRASAQKAVVDARVLEAQRNLREKLSVLSRRIHALRNQLGYLQDAEAQTFIQFELVEREREAGTKTLSDVIETRLNYERFGLQTVRSKYDLERQLLEFFLLTGELAVPQSLP